MPTSGVCSACAVCMKMLVLRVNVRGAIALSYYQHKILCLVRSSPACPVDSNVAFSLD